MAVEIGPVISFLAQRIIAAPPEVEVPRAFGRGTPIRRFREGLITEAAFRQELQDLGYPPQEVERALELAALERDYDLFQDRLRVVQEAFEKDIISFEEMKVQVLALVPDEPKALTLVDLYDFRKRPKPKALTPEEPPTLTVGRLLAAFRAGVLGEPGLRSELAERGFSAEDIDIMIAVETARLPKPKPAQLRALSLGDLRAMLALGVITPEEFRAELLERAYSPEDADRLMALELSRIIARTPA